MIFEGTPNHPFEIENIKEMILNSSRIVKIDGKLIKWMKITFLNGDSKEKKYMNQLEGFVVEAQQHKVCNMVKLLYGLRQALISWYKNNTKHFLSMNFQ